jgi:hypothetical protein
LNELDITNLDLRAAEARRKACANQTELAKLGVLGIDYENQLGLQGPSQAPLMQE